ncbi:MAG: homoserine kinase [Planctomycetota bacterium]|nr:homoserine kinase [Planctomycetota bacterium]
MSADRFSMKVRVPASTSNLGSGFDVVGLALQMYLEVEVLPGGVGLTIEAEGIGAEKIPRDASNLIYRMIAEHAGDTLPAGLRLKVSNGIPLTRGFGSSAAATVAGIAIGQWIRKGTPPERQPVLEAATRVEGHPDNASACVLGGLTVSAVIDDAVVATSMRVPYGLEIVVVIPDREISTRKAREMLPLTIPRAEAVFNLQRLGLLLSGLYLNKKEFLYHGVQDRIHQNRRYPLLPAMGATVRALNEHRTCLGAFVSGAGPAIAAFTSGGGAKLGALGVDVFRKRDIDAEYRVVAPDYLGLTF